MMTDGIDVWVFGRRARRTGYCDRRTCDQGDAGNGHAVAQPSGKADHEGFLGRGLQTFEEVGPVRPLTAVGNNGWPLSQRN
jgi:hypothetical protein